MRKQSPWVPIAACLVVQVCVGILYLWSALKQNMVQAYGWDSGAANMVSSYMILAFVLGNFGGGLVNDKRGPKLTCLLGMALFASGICLSAFVKSIALFDVTYAVIAGLGSGFAYGACISCIQKWLPHKRGLASGLACSAFGLSTVIFTPFTNVLMELHRGADGVVSFRPVFLTLALIFAVLGFLACVFICLPDKAYLDTLPATGKTASSARDLSLWDAIHRPVFWALFFSIFFINGTWNLCVPLIKDLGMQRGLTEATAIACVSFTGITNAAGRLVMASLSDRLGRAKTMHILSGITFLCAVLLTFIPGTGYFVTIALVAFAYGGPSAVNAALSTDLFGPKNSGTNYGVAMTALGLSSVFFNFISSRVLHATVENVASTFIMGAVTALIPIALMIYIKRYLDRQAA